MTLLRSWEGRVDYFRSDNLLLLRDDGLGMTREDFEGRWLTLGTESKVGANDPGALRWTGPRNASSRPITGEKGIGRLAIAAIGPQVLVLTRAVRPDGLRPLVVCLIHWGLFEIPGVDLDSIEIPIEEVVRLGEDRRCLRSRRSFSAHSSGRHQAAKSNIRPADRGRRASTPARGSVTREGDDDIDLSVLAPPMQPDEALSSWLVRIADAHLITVPELEEILGAPITGPDRGDLTLLPRIAAMTRVREDVLAKAPLADLIAHPIPQHEHPFRGRCRAPSCWAVCEDCLELDKDRGVPPHIRRTWTHPLATICPEHGGPLICYNYSKIGIAGQITIYDLERVFELLRQIRIVLGDFDDHDMLVRAGVFLLEPASGGPAQQELIKLRTAVSDLIDALATRMRPPRTEALISIFDDRFKGRVLRGTRYIPSGLWEELDADTRLICTRMALRILAEPVDPHEDEKKFPTADWPEAWYRHSRIKGWQSVFSHAIRDPLFLVATELPRAMVLELGERSRAWPADLRRRWTYAAAVGAFSGCVF